VRKVLDARNPHAHHRVCEEGVVGRHDQVAHPRQHQAARDAGALHHRDHRLGQLAPSPTHPEIDLHLTSEALIATGAVHMVPPHDRAIVVVHVVIPLGGTDVMPGTEVLPRAGEHDDVNVVVLDRPGERRVERVGHRGVLCVAVLRAVHGHHGHPVSHAIGHHVVITLHLITSQESRVSPS
jgi:hypothetical protein